jgi:hypothetical protein
VARTQLSALLAGSVITGVVLPILIFQQPRSAFGLFADAVGEGLLSFCKADPGRITYTQLIPLQTLPPQMKLHNQLLSGGGFIHDHGDIFGLL